MFSEPIGLECVYTILREMHEVKILDLMADGADFLTECRHFNPDVVGLTSLCIDVFAVRELAQSVKAHRPEVVTVVGGTQAYLAPENYFVPEIDHILQFTTVENLHVLFQAIERQLNAGQDGRVSPWGISSGADSDTIASGGAPLTVGVFPVIEGVLSKANAYQSTGKVRVNDYIIPDRRSTAQYREQYSYFGYRPCAIMQTSRGCSSVCKFCMRWKLEGTREEDVPMDVVIGQIREITEPNIMFYDNNFLYNGSRLAEFCERLEAEGIKKTFIAYGSVRSIIENAAILPRLRQNGLRALLVGYESFDQRELNAYSKKITIEDNLRASKILRDAGIDCWASFILNPDWSVADFKAFRRYLQKLKPEISSLVPMTPFPKTGLYELYKDRLLYAPDDFDQWSFSIVMVKPGKMSLRRYYYEVLKSNLFVNLTLNNPTYMMRKFGPGTVFRIAVGSLRFLKTYTKLMLKG